jgi:anti-sigma factor RsiW
MNCDGVIRRISSYIDGELETTIVAEIELHLKECPECATLVLQTKLIIHLYHDADLADFPVDVQARLHETLRRKISGDRI